MKTVKLTKREQEIVEDLLFDLRLYEEEAPLLTMEDAIYQSKCMREIDGIKIRPEALYTGWNQLVKEF